MDYDCDFMRQISEISGIFVWTESTSIYGIWCSQVNFQDTWSILSKEPLFPVWMPTGYPDRDGLQL